MQFWKNLGKCEKTQPEARRNYLVPEPNFHARIFFLKKNLLAIEMKKRY